MNGIYVSKTDYSIIDVVELELLKTCKAQDAFYIVISEKEHYVINKVQTNIDETTEDDSVEPLYEDEIVYDDISKLVEYAVKTKPEYYSKGLVCYPSEEWINIDDIEVA
ncbi:MAG: hypothetical protein GY787_21450 [Alteromonadales bacterium]|nr:hypothetical protein [Alteromonadales bacterium]